MKERKNNIRNNPKPASLSRDTLSALVWTMVILSGAGLAWYQHFENQYKGRIYSTVSVGGVSFGGKTPNDVGAYWLNKNKPFEDATFTFSFNRTVATISGMELDAGYDATLSATQAHLVGRSGNIASDTYAKFIAQTINLTPYFRWKDDVLGDFLHNLAEQIDIPVADALFQFNNGKVTSFRPSHDGRGVNIEETKKRFSEVLSSVPDNPSSNLSVPIVVETIKPSFATNDVNAFGIKELIGTGYSEFSGSIPGRIHNVTLAAAKINGILIKPGETFSFNDAVGDISAQTGFQQAYIIKEGRTVLGDGGGVCQVSTTLFRAALAAGLSIVERRAHAYRVHYYEEGGFKAGIDATVFAPSVDLKFKNNTPGYILIQTKIDPQTPSLTFELYGTSDGRQATIFNHNVWGETPPPPTLYQDDPTLPKGVVKQVDFAAWGAKASFQYKVTRNGQILEDTTFNSNFQPWQAVYLRGTL